MRKKKGNVPAELNVNVNWGAADVLGSSNRVPTCGSVDPVPFVTVCDPDFQSHNIAWPTWILAVSTTVARLPSVSNRKLLLGPTRNVSEATTPSAELSPTIGWWENH